jgi:hypothetical protein
MVDEEIAVAITHLDKVAVFVGDALYGCFAPSVCPTFNALWR